MDLKGGRFQNIPLVIQNWPFENPQNVGGYLNLWKGHLTIPKKITFESPGSCFFVEDGICFWNKMTGLHPCVTL